MPAKRFKEVAPAFDMPRDLSNREIKKHILRQKSKASRESSFENPNDYRRYSARIPKRRDSHSRSMSGSRQ
jgi:hypothetical protein